MAVASPKLSKVVATQGLRDRRQEAGWPAESPFLVNSTHWVEQGEERVEILRHKLTNLKGHVGGSGGKTGGA